MFSSGAWADYQYWVAHDPKTLARVNTLIEACTRQPFQGIGKPEPLKGDLTGWWSRRINREDRLVYRVSGSGQGQTLEIAQVRFHN